MSSTRRDFLQAMGLAAASAAIPASGLAAQEAKRPVHPAGLLRRALDENSVNVVYYLIDALRADHLGIHGYHRELAPNIRALAEQGITFTHAFANATWTKPSVASTFASVPAEAQGWRGLGGQVPNALVLFTEVLRERFAETCIVTENPYPTAISNLARGSSFVKRTGLPSYHEQWEFSLNEALSFLQHHKDRRFFLYVHTMEPHAPYRPKPHYLNLVMSPGEEPEDVDRYDAEIALADDNLQRFVSKLKSLGLYEKTLLIITADHGEAFREHEGLEFHGGKPYNELIHVPLIMHLPGVLPRGETVQQAVQLRDISPTILDVFNAPIPEQFQGKSLLPLIEGRTEGFQDRTIFSTSAGVTAAVKGRWKLLSGSGMHSLFDLSADPQERKDVAGAHSAVATLLSEETKAHHARQRAVRAAIQKKEDAATVELDTDELEALRALGYIE
ncbi:MAG: sulfatase [Candidatus Bipolaricaulota bacterium]